MTLKQADAIVEDSKATAEQAKADYHRYSQLSNAAVWQQKVELAPATDLAAKTAFDQAVADRDVACSEVRAAVNGRITNLELRSGNYADTGKGVMALIVSDTLRVEGYFKETKRAHQRRRQGIDEDEDDAYHA